MQENEIGYGLDAVRVVVRFSDPATRNFNDMNPVAFELLKSEICSRPRKVFFQKVGKDRHRLLVEVKAGWLELVVRHDGKSGSYVGIVSKRSKTAFHPTIEEPQQDFKRIECQLEFIHLKDEGRAYKASDAMWDLVEAVDRLELASPIRVDRQQEIWYKNIQAQQALLADLEKAFEVKGPPRVRPIWDRKEKDKALRYKLNFDLAREPDTEFLQLERELRREGIVRKINGSGELKLVRKELKALDLLIEKKFLHVLERSPSVGAILKLEPLRPEVAFQRALGPNVHVTVGEQAKGLSIPLISNVEIDRLAEEFGYMRRTYKARFKVDLGGELVSQVKSVGKEDAYPSELEVFGVPHGEENGSRTYRLLREDFRDFGPFLAALREKYGRAKVSSEVETLYDRMPGKKSYGFAAGFWAGLKRDLSQMGLLDGLNERNQTLYLEFIQWGDLDRITRTLKAIGSFQLAFSPLEEDFQFKVKLEVVARKSMRQKFEEKLKRLRGADVVVEVEEEGRMDPNLLFLGKLNGNESNASCLVLDLNNRFPDEQKMAAAALAFLKGEEKPRIKSVRANLKGDRMKISWLQNAIKKITSPSESPNGKPVNFQLGKYLFDSSLARPIYDTSKIDLNSVHGQDLRDHELLKLNDSQRKAVLAAVYATDISLVQGPPGTGKTTVIAEMIWQMIRANPQGKILLTSETNLAVDNALDRLLNEKSVNPKLVRNLTLIKPLRFGRMRKMDEEGARYSLARIRQWENPEYKFPEEATVGLDEADDEESAVKNSPMNNAVADWMTRIAARSLASDPRYAEVLKQWVMDLAFPQQDVKEVFVRKYFEYANIVGSTCSSSGSPQFMWDYAETVLALDVTSLKSLHFKARRAPFGQEFGQMLGQYGVPEAIQREFRAFQNTYYEDKRALEKAFKNEVVDVDRLPETVDRTPGRDASDTKQLLSYQALIEYSEREVAPYFECHVSFEAVIMDEASKATPPELLLPLCFGKRAIVIGDHRQLPPMLNELDFREALEEAGAGDLAREIDSEYLDTSQFERMILNPKVHPSVISRCTIQYRMHPHINAVIRQFYVDEGGLDPAWEIQQNADFPDLSNPFSRWHGLSLDGFISPDTHVLWVDVKGVESREGTSVVNHEEVEAVSWVITKLKESGGFKEFQEHWTGIKDEFKRLQEQQIGVISFYGAQKRLLKGSLSGLGVPLKINTVDRFQGMERNIVVVSTVRSGQKMGENGKVLVNRDSGFAKSPQRLNVALSRARRLLIVVGDKDFFANVKDKDGKKLYQNAIDQISEHGLVIDYEELKMKERDNQ